MDIYFFVKIRKNTEVGQFLSRIPHLSVLKEIVQVSYRLTIGSQTREVSE